MVRLSHDAASQARTAQDRRIREAIDNVMTGMQSLREAVAYAADGFAAMGAQAVDAARCRAWSAQYPLYRCPAYRHGTDSAGEPVKERCGRTWDRAVAADVAELRMAVYDHLTTEHYTSENGISVAGMLVAEIMDRP